MNSFTELLYIKSWYFPRGGRDFRKHLPIAFPDEKKEFINSSQNLGLFVKWWKSDSNPALPVPEWYCVASHDRDRGCVSERSQAQKDK